MADSKTMSKASAKRTTAKRSTAKRRVTRTRQPTVRQTPAPEPQAPKDPGPIASESQANQAISAESKDGRPSVEAHHKAVHRLKAKSAAPKRGELRAAGLSQEIKRVPAKGDMVWLDADGVRHEPIACGVHRSIPVENRGSNDTPNLAVGYQPDCDECKAQFASAVEAAARRGGW